MTASHNTVFQGELQLVAWGESSTAGAWVKFWVHPEDLEHFKTLQMRKGQTCGMRLAAVMVQIGPDEAVVPQQTPAPTAPPLRHKIHLGDLALVSVRWCREPSFHQWVSETANDEWLLNMMVANAGPADIAKAFILNECGITPKHGAAASRKHLDTDPEAAARFHERIRIPYRQYRIDQGLDQ